LNLILFWTYILAIIILISVIMIIIFAWRDYFPRRWLLLLVLAFINIIGGIFVLLIAELFAPYNSNFYINPTLYIIYFILTGFSIYCIYLLVLEIHFKHMKPLLVIGFIVFITLMLLLIISGILLTIFELSSYPLIAYLAFEFVYGLGITAYILLAIGSFSNISSDRLEKNVRCGLALVGIFSLGIAFGLAIIALGLLFIDFSLALDPSISIFWLLWISFVSIIFLIMIRHAIKLII